MFFWVFLASLMAVITFGNLHEKTKPAEDFVAPIYEAMAMNVYQHHVISEQGYLETMKTASQSSIATEMSSASDIVPLLSVTYNDSSKKYEFSASNLFYNRIMGLKPTLMTPQAGTASYLFCIDKTQNAESSCAAGNNNVKYIVTIRPIPPKYASVDKMTALKKISEATNHSRFIGMLQKADTSITPPASGEPPVFHQPFGSFFYIMSAGVAKNNSVFIPNYIVCNLPLPDGSVLGDKLVNASSGTNYIIAMTLLSGLERDENLPCPLGGCPAQACTPSGG